MRRKFLLNLTRDASRYLPLLILSVGTSVSNSHHPPPNETQTRFQSSSNFGSRISSRATCLCEEIKRKDIQQEKANDNKEKSETPHKKLNTTERQYKSYGLFLHGKDYNVLMDENFPLNHHENERKRKKKLTNDNSNWRKGIEGIERIERIEENQDRKTYRSPYVIVGYGVAGVMALSTMKEIDPSVEVLIVDEGDHSHCRLHSQLHEEDNNNNKLKEENRNKETLGEPNTYNAGGENLKSRQNPNRRSIFGTLFYEKKKSRKKESLQDVIQDGKSKPKILKPNTKNNTKIDSVQILDNTTITKIDPYKKILYSQDNRIISFDKCLLTIGSAPPPISSIHVQDPTLFLQNQSVVPYYLSHPKWDPNLNNNRNKSEQDGKPSYTNSQAQTQTNEKLSYLSKRQRLALIVALGGHVTVVGSGYDALELANYLIDIERSIQKLAFFTEKLNAKRVTRRLNTFTTTFTTPTTASTAATATTTTTTTTTNKANTATATTNISYVENVLSENDTKEKEEKKEVDQLINDLALDDLFTKESILDLIISSRQRQGKKTGKSVATGPQNKEKEKNTNNRSVTLILSEATPMGHELPRYLSGYLRARLEKKGVTVIPHTWIKYISRPHPYESSLHLTEKVGPHFASKIITGTMNKDASTPDYHRSKSQALTQASKKNALREGEKGDRGKRIAADDRIDNQNRISELLSPGSVADIVTTEPVKLYLASKKDFLDTASIITDVCVIVPTVPPPGSMGLNVVGPNQFDIGYDGGIIVNRELMATSSVYVAGDTAVFPHPLVHGCQERLRSVDHAAHSGVIAGANMMGKNYQYKHLPIHFHSSPSMGLRMVMIGECDSKMETHAFWWKYPPSQNATKRSGSKNNQRFIDSPDKSRSLGDKEESRFSSNIKSFFSWGSVDDSKKENYRNGDNDEKNTNLSRKTTKSNVESNLKLDLNLHNFDHNELFRFVEGSLEHVIDENLRQRQEISLRESEEEILSKPLVSALDEVSDENDYLNVNLNLNSDSIKQEMPMPSLPGLPSSSTISPSIFRNIQSSLLPKSATPVHGCGVVYYIQDERIEGILLWNVPSISNSNSSGNPNSFISSTSNVNELNTEIDGDLQEIIVRSKQLLLSQHIKPIHHLNNHHSHSTATISSLDNESEDNEDKGEEKLTAPQDTVTNTSIMTSSATITNSNTNSNNSAEKINDNNNTDELREISNENDRCPSNNNKNNNDNNIILNQSYFSFSMHLDNRQNSIGRLRQLSIDILGKKALACLHQKPALYNYTQARGLFNGNATKNGNGDANSNSSVFGKHNIFSFRMDNLRNNTNDSEAESHPADGNIVDSGTESYMTNIIGESSVATSKVPLGYLNRLKREDIIFKSSSSFKNSKESLQEAYYTTLSKAKQP